MQSKMADGILKKLPEEIFIYVLLRFSVKSLLRFKCISKTWYILVHSSTFTNIYLNHTPTAKNELILFKRSVQEEYERYKIVLSFLSNDGSDILNPVSPDFDIPELAASCSSDFDKLIGPCHGLIVLVSCTDCVIFNPTTRHYRVLPPSPFGCPQGFYRNINCIGFGFDPIVNDYKIVRISEVYTDPYEYPYTKMREKKVEVYEVGIDSWRELDDVDQQVPGIYWLPCSQKYYKGACHWFTNTLYSVAIFCFDITTETFRIMKMPDCCRFLGGTRYGLVILDESLTLICYHDRKPQVDPILDLMDIWIMQEYGVFASWVKKYTIRPLPIESPLAGWKDYLLFFQSINGLLISYDLKSHEVKELNLHGFPGSLSVVVYTESLTAIPRGSGHGTQVQIFYRTYNSSAVT